MALWYAFTGTEGRDRDFRGFLAQRLQPFLAAAEQILNLYIPEGRCYSIVDGLRFHWTPEIARFVLEQTRRIDLSNSCWDVLSALGLAEAPELFEEYLWGEFRRLSAHWGEGRDARLITIVALLLRHAKLGTWTALRDLIFAEPSIGQEAVGRAGDVSQEHNWLEHMGDGEIAEFYIWMVRQFPADIGQIQGATFFTGPLAIRILRESAWLAWGAEEISRSSVPCCNCFRTWHGCPRNWLTLKRPTSTVGGKSKRPKGSCAWPQRTAFPGI